MKLLGPWPILQFMFGISVLAGGVWMIIRGTQKKDGPINLIEDKRAEWMAYEQLKNIEENSFRQVELLSRQVDQLAQLREKIDALITAMWRERQ